MTGLTVIEDVVILSWDREEPVVEGATVVVQGPRIVEVTTGRPAGSARRIAGRGAFLMPGLIDAHMHCYGSRHPDPLVAWLDSPALSALRAGTDVSRMLRMGVTTVRDCGSRAGVAVRRAIAEGSWQGPQVFAANMGIAATGGHADIAALPLEHVRERPFQAYLADGADGMRAAVRRTVREGADHIKVWVTGGVLAEHDDPQQVQLSVSELAAVVDEAHALGRRVAAHCQGVAGTRRAVAAGVDSIEHGHYLDDAACSLMRERGVWLVPTLSFLNRAAGGKMPGLPAYAVAKAREVLREASASVERAARHGVGIAMGSDTFSEPAMPFNRSSEELVFMVDAGMTPDAVLRAATLGAAGALGLDDRGAVREGLRADLLLVDRDPRVDVGILTDPRRIRLVMKEGQVVR